MKLFQIEEPDGTPADPDAPGLAIGVDVSGGAVEVAVAVGGNAVVLTDREGFEKPASVPAFPAPPEAWQELFEAARIRAERALARPVTHAVIVLAETPAAAAVQHLLAAAERAGFRVLRFLAAAELPPSPAPVLAAAILAEDLAPPPEAAPVGGVG